MSVLVFIPSIIGTALGFGAMDRRLGTPGVVWVAAVGNSIMLAVLLLLCVIGTIHGG